MGIDRHIMIVPYAKVTTEVIKAVEPACQRPQISLAEVKAMMALKGISISEAQVLVQRASDCKMKEGDKFCPGCGMSAANFKKTNKVEKEAIDFNGYETFGDDLCTNGNSCVGLPTYKKDDKVYRDYCYYPNHTGFFLKFEEDEADVVDFASVDQEKEIERFKKAYKKQLAQLEEAYGSISFHYGLIQYFS